MSQGRAKHRRPAECRRHARNNLDIQFLIPFRQLIDQTGHTVHTGVAAGNHGDGFAAHGCINSHLTAFCFLAHGCFQIFLVRKQGTNQIRVYSVPGNHLRGFQRFHGANGHFIRCAGANADNIQFIQMKHSISAAQRLLSRHPVSFC